MPVSYTDVCRLGRALTPVPTMSPLWAQYAHQFNTLSSLCGFLLYTYWTPDTMEACIRHLHRVALADTTTMSDTRWRTIARTYFATVATGVRYVMRIVYNNVPMPRRALVDVTNDKPRTKTELGVVVTTYGKNGVYVRRCITSIYRCVDTSKYNVHVILYVNEVTDDLTLSLDKVFRKLTLVHVKDQTANGGLTGTWNQGIDWCRRKRCTCIVLSNDDVMLTNSINHVLREACACAPSDDVHRYFGTLSNNAGPGAINVWQHGTRPVDDEDAPLQTSNYRALNGFWMVFPTYVLERNRYDKAHYFDPNKPFGGNEVEWAERFFRQPNHQSVVVQQSFVHHTKLQQWKPKDLRKKTAHALTTCAYTINTGGYETKLLLSNKSFGFPVFYFCDNEATLYTAMANGLEPMFVNIVEGNPQLTQRLLKTAPHKYLPTQYTCSVYVDGNCIPLRSNFEQWLQHLYDQRTAAAATTTPEERLQVLCWKHPVRTSIRAEAVDVVRAQLESQSNVDAMLQRLDDAAYTTEKDTVLTETNALIRFHNETQAFANEWADCVRVCRRDQVSFDFLLDKHKVRVLRGAYKSKPIRRTRHTGNIFNRIIH